MRTSSSIRNVSVGVDLGISSTFYAMILTGPEFVFSAD